MFNEAELPDPGDLVMWIGEKRSSTFLDTDQNGNKKAELYIWLGPTSKKMQEPIVYEVFSLEESKVYTTINLYGWKIVQQNKDGDASDGEDD